MNPLPSDLELRRLAGDALAEVLLSWLQFPATELTSGSKPSDSPPEPSLLTTVTLQGERLSGAVQLLFPESFAGHAANVLLGPEGAASRTDAQLRDLCGELGNMIAGRLAADLRSRGHRCTLGTPTVSPTSSAELKGGFHHLGPDRRQWHCQGFRIGLDVRCQPSPA